MAKALYFARRPFGYDDGSGQTVELDRMQVFGLVGARNDEKLVRLGYCAELDKAASTHECGVCGARFLEISARDAHGDRRHRQVSYALDPREEERRLEREEARLDQVAPLFLEKTAASARG